MSFRAERLEDRWFVRDGPMLFGPYGMGETVRDGALVLNQGAPDRDGSRTDALLGRGGGLGLDPMEKAESLLRSGRTDEEVERLTGVSMSDILSLRAKLATDAERVSERRRTPRRGGVSERRR